MVAGTSERVEPSSPQRHLSGRYLTACLLILALLPGLFYGTMLRRGWEPDAPDTGAARPFGIWGDTERAAGRTPDWYPHILGGMPAHGSFLYTPRSPLNPLAAVQGQTRDYRGVYYVLLLFVAGAGTFFMLRRHGCSAVSSTLGALVYSLTPYFPGAVAAGHSTKLEALCLLPWFLLAFDALLERPDLPRIAGLAAAGALLAWSNHPQIAFYAAMIAVIIAAGRWLLLGQSPRSGLGWGRLAGAFLLAGVLALLLAAEPYLAVREYTGYSIRGGAVADAGAGGGGGVGWDYATGWSFHPRELIAFLFPAWFGLEGQTYWGPMPFTQSTHYVGVIALALAIYGLVRVRDRRRWIWAIASVVVLLVGFGRHLPVLYGPMYHLVPYFNKFRVPSMIYSVLPFCLAWLAAAGTDVLAADVTRGAARGAREGGTTGAGEPGASRKRRGTGAGGAGTAGAATAGAGTAGSGAEDSRAAGSRAAGSGGAGRARAGTDAVQRRIMYAAAGVVVLGLLALAVAQGGGGLLRPQEVAQLPPAVAEELRQQRHGMQLGSVARSCLFLLAAVGALLFGRASFIARPRRGTVVALALSALAVADIFELGKRFYHVKPRVEAASLVPMPGAADFLSRQNGPFRIFPAERAAFGSNAFGLKGLESIGGYHPAKLRSYQDLLGADLITSPGVLRMLNTRYVLAPSELDWPTAPLHREGGLVYEFEDALPRAWAVRRIERVPDQATMLARLGSETFDPAEVALVYASAPDLPTGDRFAPADVTVTGYGTGRLSLEVEAPEQSFVVISEMAYPPGWRVRIDGRDVRAARVNHVLMGIGVPAGRSRIELEFHSGAAARGRGISRAAAAATVLLAGAGFLLNRKRRPAADA